MAESTPLLVDTDATADSEAFDNFNRLVNIFKHVSLVLSSLTLSLIIADYIIIKDAPFSEGYYTWKAVDACKELGAIMVVSLLFCILNILLNLPRLLNVVVDLLLAAFIIPIVTRFIDAFPVEDWCKLIYRYPGTPNPEPIYPNTSCKSWKLVASIMMGIAAGFGAILSIIYLVLLVLRVISIFHSVFWRRPLTWSLPTGTISFSMNLSLKFMRENREGPGENASGDVGSRSRVGSGSGHGAVYLQ